MESKLTLTGSDFGFKIEEKAWLPSFNTREAPLWAAVCVQGGQKGQDPGLTKLTSSEWRADLTEVNKGSFVREDKKQAVTKTVLFSSLWMKASRRPF